MAIFLIFTGHFFGLIFLIFTVFAFKNDQSIKSITFDNEAFIHINDEERVPIVKIISISVFDSERSVWQICFFDDNGNSKNVKFVPILYTFQNFKQVLLEKNPNVDIEV
jgi:hypothetical protein